MIKAGDLILNRYKVLNTIGHGGMSDVFEAKDLIFKREVAIKVIKEEYIDNIENLIRFQNEARITACLNHPNIVNIYDYGEINNLPFIVDEFVKDQTLRDVLDFKRALSVKESCSIMLQLLDALEYIHSKNIIHRDIKPQNIFYGVDGSIKLADFGISIIKGSRLNINENKKTVGTIQYLAPEVIKGNGSSFQSDIYALGILFYELIIGKVPLDASTVKECSIKVLTEEIEPPSKFNNLIPKEVDEIIFKATNKSLEKRYKSCKEMKDDILKIMSNKKIINKGTGFLSRLFGLSRD